MPTSPPRLCPDGLLYALAMTRDEATARAAALNAEASADEHWLDPRGAPGRVGGRPADRAGPRRHAPDRHAHRVAPQARGTRRSAAGAVSQHPAVRPGLSRPRAAGAESALLPARTSCAPATSASSLAKAASRGRYFMPQSGARDELGGALVGQRAADALGHRLGRLDRGRVQRDDPEDDRLAGQRVEHAEVEVRLRGLDRDLLDRAGRQLGEERVGRRMVRHEGRIAEADVQRGRALHAVERALERRQRVAARLLGARLHPRLVELHDVGAGGEEVEHLLAHDVGVGEGQVLLALVEVVLGLLGHGERAGQRDLHEAVRVGPQEAQVVDRQRLVAAQRAGDARAPGSGCRCGSASCPGRSRSIPCSAVAKRLE